VYVYKYVYKYAISKVNINRSNLLVVLESSSRAGWVRLSSLGISKKCLTPTVTISPDSSAVRGVVLKKVYSNHETQCVHNIFLVNSGTPL
jgi:hypothetical protein